MAVQLQNSNTTNTAEKLNMEKVEHVDVVTLLFLTSTLVKIIYTNKHFQISVFVLSSQMCYFRMYQ